MSDQSYDALTPPPDHPAPDGFSIERELGGGGMSRVFLARDERLARRVVIKVLLPSLAATLSVERFEREIRLATQLQHPNIVPVLSAGEIGDLPYFVMPFIEGESLRQRLLRGPLSVRETVGIMKDITRALAYAHGHGIVHRDIKPGNVLLAQGAAVVSDFGVAKALAVSRTHQHEGGVGHGMDISLTAIGTSLGTPAYMAPEQAAADPDIDHRADLYALGIVAYEMLIGTPPFHGRTPQALLTAQLSDAPPSIAARRYDVPVRLADLVMHNLEKDPIRRPKSASDVLRRLEDPEVVSGTFAVTPTVRRRSQQSMAVAVAALIAVVAIAWWAARRSSSADEVARAAQPAPRAAAIVPRAARSIAVLPLTAIGGDRRAAAIADGMTSQLAGAIAEVPGLRVTTRSVSPAQRDSLRTAGIGQSLGVGLFVEGTVQREGEQLRVMLRVVDATADSTAWSSSFTGRADSVLTLQDNAARALVRALVLRPQPR